MEITLEDLKALTLFAQDPDINELAKVKAQLVTPAAKDVATIIVGEPLGAPNPLAEDTAQAIMGWVKNNLTTARGGQRAESRTKRARDWVGSNSAAWSA